MYAMSRNNHSHRSAAQGGESLVFSPQTERPQHEPQQQQQQQQQAQQPQRLPGQKLPKIRTSCDSCAIAKVRCSKEHPRCERCIESNFSCVYGLSMKHGKGSQKRRHSTLQTATDASQAIPGPLEQKYNYDLQGSFSDVLDNIDSTASISSIQPWPFNNDVVMNDAMLNSIPQGTASPVFDDLFWSNATTNGSGGTIGNGIMSPTWNGPANTYLETLDDPSSLLSNMDFSLSTKHEPSSSTSSQSSSASPVLLSKNIPLPQPKASHGSSGKHDCYLIANSTLAMLHVSSRAMSNHSGNDAAPTTFSNPTAHIPMQTAQHLDEVLRCTKEAMANVSQLLECSCASDSQMAMLYASILIRILFWHQVAAGAKTSTSLPLPSWDGSPLTDPLSTTRTVASRSQRSFCSTSTASVASEPVKIGNYIPDQEDQESMRRLFLLVSLKRLGRLIEVFSQVEDPVSAGPSHIRSILASWLNSELSQTIQVVGKGAKTAVGQQP